MTTLNIDGAELAGAILELLRADGVLYLLSIPFRAPVPRQRFPIRDGRCEWCGEASRPGRLWCWVCWAYKMGEGPAQWPVHIPAEAERVEPWGGMPTVSASEAIAAGLTIKVRRKSPARKPITLRGECKCCEGLRAVNDVFCLRCWSSLLQFESAGASWQEAFDAAAMLYGSSKPAHASSAA